MLGIVDSCVVVVEDVHHIFLNFDLESSYMDEECREIVVFSQLKGFYWLCSKVEEQGAGGDER